VSPTDGALTLRLTELTERFRRSLFAVPALWVLALIALSRLTLAVDERSQNDELPSVFSTTVDSGRALLASIASGTITAASVVFSLTLVSVQMASSQFSPRTLRNFLGDRFQQNVFGIVLGTFAFSIAILRQIREPLRDGGSPLIPQFGITVATVMALVSLFALLGSINRTARSLRVTSVAKQIVEETLSTIDDRFPLDRQPMAVSAPGRLPSPVEPVDDHFEPAAVVTADTTGWIQQMSIDALAESLPEGSAIRLDVSVGSYISRGQVLATISPIPEVDAAMMRDLRSACSIGDTRTLQSDVAYGILQLEDIALRALSPGINDPNTAIAIVSQMGTILLDLLGRDLEPRVSDVRGRTVRRPVEPDFGDYLGAALDKVRRAARDEPAVLSSILRMLAMVRDELDQRRQLRTEVADLIEHEASLIVAEAERCAALDEDTAAVGQLALELSLIEQSSGPRRG